jgi:hypothetical protein
MKPGPKCEMRVFLSARLHSSIFGVGREIVDQEICLDQVPHLMECLLVITRQWSLIDAAAALNNRIPRY